MQNVEAEVFPEQNTILGIWSYRRLKVGSFSSCLFFYLVHIPKVATLFAWSLPEGLWQNIFVIHRIFVALSWRHWSRYRFKGLWLSWFNDLASLRDGFSKAACCSRNLQAVTQWNSGKWIESEIVSIRFNVKTEKRLEVGLKGNVARGNYSVE